MPVEPYGVLVGRALDRRREGAPDDTPHYQVHVQDDGGTSYRAAVNVQSQQAPSELLYLVDDDFSHPVTALLHRTGSGWSPLPATHRTAHLDFVRGNLFPRDQMRVLPADLTGPDNDLADLLDHYVARAVADPAARVYVFGERWGPEDDTADKVFGFRPGNGVHNVHMNQGNSAAFRRDDGVWQDGALLLHFPARSRWVAVFLAFQSQAWHTDDETGHTIPTVDPRPEDDRPPLEIVAALVNPIGPAPEAETVTVVNASPDTVELTGWKVADRLGRTSPVPSVSLSPGSTVTVPVADGMQLGNDGGTITLLDGQGLKVHGVAYTAQSARRPGWTVVF